MIEDSFWSNIFKRDDSKGISIYTILKETPVFKDLSKKEIKAIERILHRRQYKKEENIFYENDPGVGMYIIEDGLVNIVQGKQHKLLAVLSRGDFFGEIALLAETPRTAGAVASSDLKLLGFFQSDLFNLLETNPRMGNKILYRISQIIAERLQYNNIEKQHLRDKITKLEKQIEMLQAR